MLRQAGQPAELCQQFHEVAAKRCDEFYRGTGNGVGNGEFRGMEQQPVAVKFLAEETVVTSLAVAGIADYRMKDMFEVTTELVAAAGAR